MDATLLLNPSHWRSYFRCLWVLVSSLKDERARMTRVAILSDIHLSPTHGFFWANWCVARDFANSVGADAVIVNGDLAITQGSAI